MKRNVRAMIAVWVGGVLQAALLWAGLPYEVREREAPGIVWLCLCAAVAAAALRWHAPKTKPAAWILFGVCTLHTAMIIYDCALDPTNHNLLPFEYMFLGIALLPAFLAQWIVARLDPKPSEPPPLL
jgi:hypothetical protein